MLQPLPQCVPLSLPNLSRTIRVTGIPDGLQIHMAQANDTEHPVEEVRERTPAEEPMV